MFIFPTREGGVFGVLLLVMTLCAINYQNSLIFALAFLLGSLFVVGILHTFRNLSGLTLTALGSRPAFVGEDVEFSVRLSRADGQPVEALRIGWPHAVMRSVDLVDARSEDVRLYVPATERGWFRPPRLRVESTWPLTMIRAWTWLDLDLVALVYPRPIHTPLRFIAGDGDGDRGEVVVSNGNDDFDTLREYRDGDSPRRIAWKRYAQQGDLVTKTFVGYADQRRWISWDALPGVDTETRLSRLAGWVLAAARQHEPWGLRLPGFELTPGQGERHRDAALRALALYGQGQ